MSEEFQNESIPLEEEVFTSPEGEQEISEEHLENQPELVEDAETPPPEIQASEEDDSRKRKNRIYQLKRDKYRALNRIQQLESEVNDLRNRNSYSNEAAMAHYDSMIQLRLEKAEKDYIQAEEIGDIQAKAKAVREMTSAGADAKSMEAWKVKQEYYNQNNISNANQYTPPNSYQEQAAPPIEYNEDTTNWLEQNQWFDERSQEYDPEMAEEVRSYAEALDRKLIRTGNANKILSSAYFNEINNYVKNNFRDYDEVFPSKQKEMIMKPINNPVSPVGRRTGSAQRPNSKDPQLNDVEKFMAKNAGVTEEEWKKWKKLDIQSGRQQRGMHR